MKQHPQLHKPIALALAASLLFSSASFAQSEKVEKTKKERSEKKPRNFDDVMEELDRATLQLEAELKKPLPPIPPIDAAKIKAEVEQAMKSIDAAQLKAEIEASVAKIDMTKIKADLEKLKDIQLPNLEAELKNLKPQIEESMKGARESIEKAKVEISEYKAFEESLQKDGLIDKEKYLIEHKDGELKINGKVQPAAIYQKHQAFLQKHKRFTLRKTEDDFDINND
jgi:hypothetical protein